MTRPVLCAASVLALASILSAQAPATRPVRAVSASMPRPVAAHAPRPSSVPPPSFQKFCFECHAGNKPEAGLSIEKLVANFSIGAHWERWEKVAEMLETGMMPPLEAEEQPTDAERAAAAAWIRSSLKAYEADHAGEPGPVTVRMIGLVGFERAEIGRAHV